MMSKKSLVFLLLFCVGQMVTAEDNFARWALNEKVVYRVFVSNLVPTTIRFPGRLSAIDGSGVCTGRENEIPGVVLLAFNQNSNYFTVRGLVNDSKAALNVTFRNKTYAFDLIVTNKVSAHRCIEMIVPQLSHVGKSGIRKKTASIACMWSLVNLAKSFDLLAKQQPRIVANVDRAKPKTVQKFGAHGDVECILEEIFRFSDDGVLVFRFRLINKSLREFCYVPHPTKLGIRVGERVFLSNICDASGTVAAVGESNLFLALGGDSVRTGMDLNNNRFQLLLSEPQYGVVKKQ